jgi:hypothetical protein
MHVRIGTIAGHTQPDEKPNTGEGSDAATALGRLRIGFGGGVSRVLSASERNGNRSQHGGGGDGNGGPGSKLIGVLLLVFGAIVAEWQERARRAEQLQCLQCESRDNSSVEMEAEPFPIGKIPSDRAEREAWGLSECNVAEYKLDVRGIELLTCPTCSTQRALVAAPTGAWSGLVPCSACTCRTSRTTTTMVHDATTESPGKVSVDQNCKHCHSRETFYRSIPRLSSSSSSSSSGSGGSSSYGGGSSSGGGGAGSSW